MRIIAGKWRGRRITPPPGDGTRPILDRAKTVLFDMLGSRLAQPGLLPPIAVLDLFAGTGTLGLEALSRGARYCRFVERHRATAAVLRGNLDMLGVITEGIIAEGEVTEGDATLFRLPAPPPPTNTPASPQDALEASRLAAVPQGGAFTAAHHDPENPGFELVFIDPPYRMLDGDLPVRSLAVLLQRLATCPEIVDSALFVVRHERHQGNGPDLSPLNEIDRKDIGTMTLRILLRPGPQDPSGENLP